MCPSSAGLGNVNFEEYAFILDIHCQQLGNMCQLNIYMCIGYILPTVGGCLFGEHGLTFKFYGVKLSVVSNCPFLHMVSIAVSNCPGVKFSAVSNCPPTLR